jgi:hypothetical protein
MKTKYKYLILILVILIVIPDLFAQCPMCRMSAESNLEHGGTEGKGLNTGILYMLALPYLMISTLGYIWYKNRKRLANQEEN